MQDKILYEYAVIRILPKVEREEFFNVGVMIYSKEKKYLKIKTYLDEAKFNLFETELDLEQVKLNLHSFELIASEDKNGGPIAQMDIASRFRWMTAVRSSCIQTSRPHPGLSENLDKTLERLFKEMVL